MTTLQDTYVDWLAFPDPGMAHVVLSSWEFHPYLVRGELAAIAMLKGTEIHLCVAPHWRGRLMTRRRISEFLAPLMTSYGFLTTRSFVQDNDTAHFLARLGFVKTWAEQGIDHWMLTALPYSKGR